MKTTLLTLLFLLATPALAHAEITLEAMEYQAGDTRLIGYLAHDPTISSLRPAVIVIHEWWGLNDYVQGRATQLAEMGYVAFCADMYGEGKSTTDQAMAGEWAGAIFNDPDLRTERLKAAYDTVAAMPWVDKSKIAVMGYCFGGSMSTYAAYQGLDLAAVISFHGTLPAPTPEEAARLDMPILICHGADDAFVKPEAIAAFKTAMAEADADMVFVEYANAVHAFSNPAAGDDPSTGVAYNETADHRSWEAMEELLEETLGEYDTDDTED